MSTAARARLAEVQAKLMTKRVQPDSQEAWILLFEAAEAAFTLMADRAAALHALANVTALCAATAPGGTRFDEDLAVLHFQALDGGERDLRVVEAALQLARATR